MSVAIAIFVAGLAQALILSWAIVRKKDGRKYPLLLLMSIIGLGLGLRIAYASSIYLEWLKLVQLSDICVLLYGPAFWFFIRSAGQNMTRAEWKAMWPHVIPSVVFLLYYFMIVLPIPNQEFITREAVGEFNLNYAIIIGSGLMVNVIYWWLSFTFIRREYKGKTFSIQFLRLVLSVNAIAILAWASGLILSFVGPQWANWYSSSYIFSFVALAASCIAISYHALSNPGFWLEQKKAKKYARSRLSNSDIEEIGQRLENYVSEEKKYLDPDFTLDQLSSSLKINKVQVSQVINQYKGKGFADWINEYRVEEFIRKVESGQFEHLTLLGIANESGFNTKATFNKAFKKAKGTTPSQYINGKTSDSKPALSN